MPFASISLTLNFIFLGYIFLYMISNPFLDFNYKSVNKNMYFFMEKITSEGISIPLHGVQMFTFNSHRWYLRRRICLLCSCLPPVDF